MSFIPEGFGEIVVTYSQTGTTRPAQWTIGVEPPPAQPPAEYLNDVITSWSAAGRVLASNSFDARATAISARLTVQTSTGPVIYEQALGVTGTRTGEAQPPNVAVLIRRNTARGGRRGRGRLYLPSAYLSEVDVQEGGVIASARRTELQTIATNIAVGAVGAGLGVPVLLHNDGVVPPDEIESMVVQNLVATMRRRLRK